MRLVLAFFLKTHIFCPEAAKRTVLPQSSSSVLTRRVETLYSGSRRPVDGIDDHGSTDGTIV